MAAGEQTPAGLVDASEHRGRVGVSVVEVCLFGSRIAVELTDAAVRLAVVHPNEVLAITLVVASRVELADHRREVVGCVAADDDWNDAQMARPVRDESD